MSKKLLKSLVALSMVVTVGLGVVGCGNKSDNASQIENIKKSGKLVLGTSADYPPYEFHKVVDGKDEIIGFDVEIAKEVAKELGVKLEIKDMGFDGLLAALDSKTVDMVVAGMNPTPERAKSVDFSNIYYKAIHGIIVRAGDEDKIKSLDDLNGKKIGVQKGSVQESLSKEQIKGAEFKSLGKISDLALELKNNKVDAIVVEVPVAQFYVTKNTDLKLTNLKLDVDANESGSAIAFKKDSKELVEAANKVLDKLIKDKKIDEFVVDANNKVE